MPNWVHRTSKQLLQSVSPNSLPEAEANYVNGGGDLNFISAVAGQPTKYWVVVGDVISLADAGARAVIDATEAATRADNTADELDRAQTIMRAFAEVVLDEVNLLRGQHALAPRTLAQLKTAVRSKL